MAKASVLLTTLGMMAEEWNIQNMFDTKEDKKVVKSEISTQETMGLASIVVDIKNQTAYTVPALGQTGYEKLMPLNSTAS